MRSLLVACTLILPVSAALADYVATPEEEAALRKSIAANPPNAATLRAEPYPGAKLDPKCSADQSAPQQGDPMVYCYYTTDSEAQVQAWLAGQGKPGAGTSAFVNGDPLVDEKGYVINDDVFFIVYYVRKEAPPPPAAAASPPPVAAPAPAAAPAATPAPAPASNDGTTEQAIEAGKKLKGLLGF